VASLLAAAGVPLVAFGEWGGLWYLLVAWFLGRLAVGSMPRRPPSGTGARRPALALEGDEGPPAQPRP
jgi:hypothetical protein